MTVRGALTVVGQVAGAYFGPIGSAVGGYIGSQIGLAIEGPQQVQGPRLDDLKITGSSYGTPIAYVEGHPRVAGTIIWASDKREIATTTEVGGKGGAEAEQTTYTYEIDVLVLLSATVIAGVRRIWSNNKLVFSLASDASVATIDASAFSEAWTELTVYGGGPSQMPDATYEAAVGAGNAPAYRGRGTVMIRGLQLGGSGQLPNLTFEIATAEVAQPLETLLLFHADDDGFTDSSAYARTPSIVGAPFVTAAADAFGGGLMEFTKGTPAQYVTFTGADMLASSSADHTLECWFKCTEKDASAAYVAGRFTFLSCYDNGSLVCEFTVAGFSDVQMVILFSGAHAITVGSLFNRNHFAVVRGGAQPGIYVNGTLQWSLVTGSYNIDTIHIGNIAAGSGFAVGGQIEEVRLTAGARYEANFSVPTAAFSSYGGPLYSASSVDLDDVVSRLCLRAGLTAPQFDVTALSTQSVRAMAVGQVTSTRQVLEILGGAYAFEAVESAGVLKFVSRGGASAATLTYTALGATTGNPLEPLPINRRNDDEAPASCVVRYINDSDDYQDGAEASDRLTGSGTGIQVLEIPLSLTPGEARKLADMTVMDIAAATMTFGPVAVNRDRAALEPTDVVLLTDVDGSTYRARILKQTETGGVKQFDLVLDDATVITSVAATTATGYTSSVTVNTPADTVMELMDIAILRDADSDAGFYAAFKGATSPWPGAVLFGGLDGISYTQRDTVGESAVIGACTTTLATYTGANVFDNANSVTVSVGAGLLASDTRDNLLTLGTNAALVGSEIIQFTTATLVSTGIYTLTGLLRGRRGTEWAMSGHAAAERFVLLQLTGLRRVANSTSEIDAERHYKAVTLGRALGTAPDEAFTNTAIGLKPWAPVDLRGSRDGSLNLTGTFSRRTRLATNFTSGTVPLGEASEAYRIEVYSDNTYVTLKRTIAASSETFAYSAADQTTDFGSAQATVWVRVYQVSATVGNGYAVQGGI